MFCTQYLRGLGPSENASQIAIFGNILKKGSDVTICDVLAACSCGSVWCMDDGGLGWGDVSGRVWCMDDGGLGWGDVSGRVLAYTPCSRGLIAPLVLPPLSYWTDPGPDAEPAPLYSYCGSVCLCCGACGACGTLLLWLLLWLP